MIRVAVQAGGVWDRLPEEADYYVGVDAGCLFLLEHGLPLDLAVGDFDSVTSADLARIRSAARSLIQAPAAKDDTDLELALKQVVTRFPDAVISVYGALGGRMDHQLANLFLPAEPDLAPYMEQIQLKDRQNTIVFRPAGCHRLQAQEGMTYVSFLPSDGSRLHIRYAKYPLDEGNYFVKKCYASNEFIDRDMEIELDKGYVLIIYSKDRD